MMDPLPECTSCGACCVPPPRVNGLYVLLDEEDVRRLPFPRRNLLIAEDDGDFFLRTKTTARGSTCICLAGEVGKKVECSVYGHRPRLCREFRRGSMFCDECRDETL